MTDSYISLDLETTGLNPKTDKIIEIGAVKVVCGEVQETFSALINPGRQLEERIVELTGISDQMLATAGELSEYFGQLLDFLEDLPFLGHRILFDYSFLKKAAVDRRLTLEKGGIDTLKIARRYLPQLPHRDLTSLCEYYGITHKAHRALGDALATHELYRILYREFGPDSQAEIRTATSCGYAGSSTQETGSTQAGGSTHFLQAAQTADKIWFPQPLHYQVKRDTPATPAQKERLARLLERYRIAPDYEIDALSRSEADRMIDRIRRQG